MTADATTIAVTAAGTLKANADGGDADAFAIALSAPGNVTIDGRIESTGGPPAGSGGSIAIASLAGNITVGAVLTVEGRGDGGDIGLDAAGTTTVNANLLASGGIDGSSAIDISSLGNVTIASGVTVQAHGGTIATDSPGVLAMNGTLDVSGRGAETAGSITLEHCTVTVNGTLDARGASSAFTGQNELIGYAITVNASAKLLATSCTPTAGHTSCNVVRIRSGTPSVAPGATITPAPQTIVDSTIKSCCGNGAPDAGEQCDDGNRLYCDTCSPQCTTPVDCDADGDACTGTCVPATGARRSPIRRARATPIRAPTTSVGMASATTPRRATARTIRRVAPAPATRSRAASSMTFPMGPTAPRTAVRCTSARRASASRSVTTAIPAPRTAAGCPSA